MTGASGAPDPNVNQDEPTQERQDFLREMVQQDLGAGRISGVVTRFPPAEAGAKIA